MLNVTFTISCLCPHDVSPLHLLSFPSGLVSSLLPMLPPLLTFEGRAFGFTNISQKQSCSGVKTSMREAVRVKFREKGRRWEEASLALLPQTEQMQLNIPCSLKRETGAGLLSLQTHGDNTLFPQSRSEFLQWKEPKKSSFPLQKVWVTQPESLWLGWTWKSEIFLHFLNYIWLTVNKWIRMFETVSKT